MKKLLLYFAELKNEDRVIFFLQISTLVNMTVVVAKFSVAFILPSLWFFVNACFLVVITVSRLLALKDSVIYGAHSGCASE